jgi:hypothetical protein
MLSDNPLDKKLVEAFFMHFHFWFFRNQFKSVSQDLGVPSPTLGREEGPANRRTVRDIFFDLGSFFSG